MTRLLTLATVLLLCAVPASAGTLRESIDRYGPFGTLHIYTTSAQPSSVTLFVSGDGGWNRGVVEMAKSLATLGSMVVGIDVTQYIRQLDAARGRCAYPAAHFEGLSHYLQKKYHFPRYTLPVLVGYSSGATLVYATLAQSPPNTFAGGISMGFCPDLKTARPICKGSGGLIGTHSKRLGFTYRPVSSLSSRLYVLQGEMDQVCSTADTKRFVGEVKGAELVELAKVGHGFGVQRNWLPQFKDVFRKLATSQPQGEGGAEGLGDLPLVVLPAAPGSRTLAVIVSGDGGWAGIDKQVAEALNKRGIGVVGLDSLQYFWKKKGPDIAGKDLERILAHYGRVWGADEFILVGYSMGADTLPFMVSRLPERLKSRVGVVALLGPGREADFEFHVAEWLFDVDGTYPVVPEVQKLKGMPVLCVYGRDEAMSACTALASAEFSVVATEGGHHFGGAYEALARMILQHSR